MNRWLLKSKEDFSAWLNAADHISKPKKELDWVNSPDIYPQVIVWHWYHDAEGKQRLAFTFVMPRDFEYCSPIA